MKQLTVISGKGGTGKTSLVAAFASLAKNAVFADCDVDASDLHLIMNPTIKEKMEFTGLPIAFINKERCIQCGDCIEYCRFDAITQEMIIIEEKCEGCGVCKHVCPVDAIKMIERQSGIAYISNTRFGPMAHARLNIGEEASGKLVSLVRENALKIAKENEKDLIIIDGSPGIGCPVIAAMTGVDLVLVVTEPTLSAIHDLERILRVANHFSIPAVVCINKYDINEKNVEKIEKFCREKDIEVVGRLPYDNIVTKAMIEGKNIIEFSTDDFSRKVGNIWANIEKILMKLKNKNKKEKGSLLVNSLLARRVPVRIQLQFPQHHRR